MTNLLYDHLGGDGVFEAAAGTQSGRTHEEKIVIFDSTGTGMQDVAASAAEYDAIGRKEFDQV